MTIPGRTILASHTCASRFQDETYGRNIRVFNLRKNGSGNCTVCGQNKPGLAAAAKDGGRK